MSEFQGFYKSGVVLRDGHNMFPSKHAFTISPSGYNWGYEGAGPLALAHTILDSFDDKETFADELYRTFMEEVISRLPRKENFFLASLKRSNGSREKATKCFMMKMKSHKFNSLRHKTKRAMMILTRYEGEDVPLSVRVSSNDERP